LFARAELKIAVNRTLVVEARNNAPDRPYIQAVRWNGQPYTKTWIRHEELARGGRLSFEMGPRPKVSYGSAPADRPPSGV
jgi:putative alpha-1,2-mannosidase